MTNSTKKNETNKEHTAHIKQVRDILDSLKEKDVYSDDTKGFSSDKTAIERIFEMTNKRTLSDLVLRLTVIDSMYSTQMNRRYYALEELAEKLHCLDEKKPLPILFKEFIEKGRNIHLFDGKDGNQDFNLFNEKYGIGKDGYDKGVAVSLISKYAYFETHYKFPIYDSIACEMYPRIWKYCGWEGKPLKTTVKDNEQQMVGDKTIVSFVEAIDDLKQRLDENISYDHLDRLLWFVGKIYRGNLSLVLDREAYMWCVDNWFEKDEKDRKIIFDITNENIKINEAYFCQKNPQLKAMFQLALDLKK